MIDDVQAISVEMSRFTLLLRQSIIITFNQPLKFTLRYGFVYIYHVGTSIFGKWRGWANLALADAPPAPADDDLDFDLNMAAATWSGEGTSSSLSSSNTGPTTSTPRDVRQPKE